MREQSALFLASVAVAITRIAALSRSMWDWDEALFCLGVRDYDVPAYRPNPPGFPLFVGAAKLLRPIAASFRRSKDASGTTSDVYAVDLTAGARAFRSGRAPARCRRRRRRLPDPLRERERQFRVRVLAIADVCLHRRRPALTPT